MYFFIYVLLFWSNFDYGITFRPCCEGENIIFQNETCWNGASVTVLSCERRILLGPKEQEKAFLEFQEDGTLWLSRNGYYGHMIVDRENHCIAKDDENLSFVALVCSSEDGPPPAEERMTMLYMKNICAFITVLFLLAVFLIYLRVKDLQDIEGRSILNFVGCLIVAHVIASLLSIIANAQPNSCHATIFFLLAAYLCAYNWLSVLSFHLWRITLQPVFQTRIPWIFAYCGYGYGLPLILVITAITDHSTRDPALVPGVNECWLEGGAGSVLAYFYGPSFIALSISIVFQVWVLKKAWLDVDCRYDEESMARIRKKSLTYAHLLLVITFLCITDFITYLLLHKNKTLDYVWDLLDCRNFLVGGIVFFILVVFRNKVLKALAKEGLFYIKFPKVWENLIDEETQTYEEMKKITIIGNNK